MMEAASLNSDHLRLAWGRRRVREAMALGLVQRLSHSCSCRCIWGRDTRAGTEHLPSARIIVFNPRRGGAAQGEGE